MGSIVDAVELFRKNPDLKIKDVMEQATVSRATAYRARIRAGLPRPTRRTRIDEAREYLLAGETPVEVTRRRGISSGTVSAATQELLGEKYRITWAPKGRPRRKRTQ